MQARTVIYSFANTLLRVVDGDTFDARVDVGFRLWTVQRFRLLDYEAPESRGPERGLGIMASRALGAILGAAASFEIDTLADDSFGRWLARVTAVYPEPRRVLDRSLDGRVDLRALLIELGYGLARDGSGKRPTFDPAAPYPIRRT